MKYILFTIYNYLKIELNYIYIKMEKNSISLLVFFALFSFYIAGDIRVSGSLIYSKLLSSEDKEITEKDLEKINVGKPLRIKIVFYDEYNETITRINNDELKVIFEPTIKIREGSYDYKISPNNGELIIDLNSTLAGKFKLTINYFQKETYYYVNFVPGELSDKSILEVDKTVITVGENVTIYIIPYDKYENLINATLYKHSNISFEVSYNNGKSNVNVDVGDPEIVNIVNYPLISYEIKLTLVGEITINAKVGKNLLNYRKITVNPIEIDFNHCEFYRYDSNNIELKVLKNGITENTTESEPTYRLYLKDKNGRGIEYLSEEQLNNLKSYLNFDNKNYVFYYFTLKYEKSTKEQYIEFAVDDDKNKIAYKKLLYGDYDLVFTQGSEILSYKTVLNNGCSTNKPFKCTYGKTKCVASQTDCGCPKKPIKYIKCIKTPYCVPDANKDMCSDDATWNKRVCPIGKVLCADLSCKDDYNLCQVPYNQCNSQRCPDQTCQSFYMKCEDIITCEKNEYVCNNEKCVKSELECSKLLFDTYNS